MANSAVLFGDGKEVAPAVMQETLKALKAGKDILKEGIGLAKILGGEAQDVAKNLNKWFKGDPLDPNSQAIIYKHADFTGDARGFRFGETVTDYQRIHISGTLFDESWSDEVSSVKVSGGAVFVVWEHANFGGNRLVFMPGTSVADLRHVGGGWHDQVSSSKVILATELGTIFP